MLKKCIYIYIYIYIYIEKNYFTHCKSQVKYLVLSIEGFTVGYTTKIPHWLEMGRIMGI